MGGVKGVEVRGQGVRNEKIERRKLSSWWITLGLGSGSMKAAGPHKNQESSNLNAF